MPVEVTDAPKPRRSSSSRTVSTADMWSDYGTEFTLRSTVAEIYGPTATGRSTLALSAPGPIAYFGAQETATGVINRYRSMGKVIRGHNFGGVFRGTPEEKAAQARAILRGLGEASIDAYRWARTVIYDTHTELHQLIRIAYFGALKPTGGRQERNWEPINAEWMAFVNAARQHAEHDNVNTVFIGQADDEWVDGDGGFPKKTGNQVRATSHKSFPYKMSVVLRTDVDPDDRSYSFTIEKAAHNSGYVDKVYTNELDGEGNLSWTWGDVMGLITDTDAYEWNEERT